MNHCLNLVCDYTNVRAYLKQTKVPESDENVRRLQFNDELLF